MVALAGIPIKVRDTGPTVIVLQDVGTTTLRTEVGVQEFIARHIAPFPLPTHRLARAGALAYSSLDEALHQVLPMTLEMESFAELHPEGAAVWRDAIASLHEWAQRFDAEEVAL